MVICVMVVVVNPSWKRLAQPHGGFCAVEGQKHFYMAKRKKKMRGLLYTNYTILYTKGARDVSGWAPGWHAADVLTACYIGGIVVASYG